MRITIARHGLTVDNKKNIVQGHLPGILAIEGIRDIRKLAKRLKDEIYDIMYSSDQGRAVESIKRIHAHHPDTPVVFTERFRDRNLGQLQGILFEDLVKHPLRKDPPDGESHEKVQIRANEVLEDLLQKHPDQNVFAMTHESFAKSMIASIMQVTRDQLADLKLDTAGISIFEIDAKTREYQTILLNCTDHLKTRVK